MNASASVLGHLVVFHNTMSKKHAASLDLILKNWDRAKSSPTGASVSVVSRSAHQILLRYGASSLYPRPRVDAPGDPLALHLHRSQRRCLFLHHARSHHACCYLHGDVNPFLLPGCYLSCPLGCCRWASVRGSHLKDPVRIGAMDLSHLLGHCDLALQEQTSDPCTRAVLLGPVLSAGCVLEDRAVTDVMIDQNYYDHGVIDRDLVCLNDHCRSYCVRWAEMAPPARTLA
jgi:hypothetical protein